MKIKRSLRLILLMLMIGLACVLPVPMTIYRKDELPKNLIEQIDTKEVEAEEDDIRELF